MTRFSSEYVSQCEWHKSCCKYLGPPSEPSVASQAKGLGAVAVSAVMRDAGLTHKVFYKHFANKDELLVESLKEGFQEIIDILVRAAEQSPPGDAWKAIVNTYLRPEMCEYPEHGCPLATLAPELARVDRRMKPQIVAELVNYKSRMAPFMPGRRTTDKETGSLCDLYNNDRGN